MIYITGGSGHIGINLINSLINNGLEFRLLLRRIPDYLEKYKDIIYVGDIFSEEFLVQHMNQHDTLIHLAGIIDLKNKKREETYLTNELGSIFLIDFAAKNNLFLIYASTVDILSSKNSVISEKSLILERYPTYYHQTKANATRYLINKIENHQIHATILYPTAVIGSYDLKPSDFSKGIHLYKKSRLLFYFEGKYNFVDVRYIANVIIEILKKNIEGCFVLGGEEVSIKRMLEIYKKSQNQKYLMIKIHKPIMYLFSMVTPWIPTVMLNALYSEKTFDLKTTNRTFLLKQRSIEELLTDYL